MASLLSVVEYATAAVLQGGKLVQVAQEPPLASYDIDFTAGEAHGATLNAKTQIVRLNPNILCAVKVDVTAVAAATDGRFPADATEFKVMVAGSGMRVSAITRT